MSFTQAQARKEINAIGKKYGFIMRKQNLRINGEPSYRFEDRITGKVHISNMSFWLAYDNAQCADVWITGKVKK